MPLNEVKTALQQVVAVWDDPHNFAEGFTEKLTCHSLIHPVLEALGWNLQTGSQVAMEYPNPKNSKKIDYVFFDRDGIPIMLLEAKATKGSLTTTATKQQIAESAKLLQTGYAVSCNGHQWRIYDVTKPSTRRKGFEGKLIEEVDVLHRVASNATKLNRLLRRRRSWDV